MADELRLNDDLKWALLTRRSAIEDGDAERRTDKLDLQVEVASPSACERHVTVTVSREDIDRYLDDAFSEMMPTANVPGFRVDVPRAKWWKPVTKRRSASRSKVRC